MENKILFVVRSLNVGGIEQYILRFLHLYHKKINVEIFCKSSKKGYFSKSFSEIDIKIITQYFGDTSVISWFNFYSFIKKNKYTTIVDFTGDFSGIVLLISKFAKIKKRIAFYRGSRYQFKPNFLKLIYVKCVNKLVKFSSTKIFSNSIEALDFFHPYWSGNKKYKVIHNDIFFLKHNDSNRVEKFFSQIPNDSYKIGHVGRFAKMKNHNLIINIARKLCAKNPKIVFILCGKGVKDGVIKNINKFSLNDRFFFMERCLDIDKFYSLIDLFLFPSKNEGQPNVLLEAMISKLPIIASDIASNRESLPDGYHKFLVKGDDIDKYIHLINKIKCKSNYFDTNFLSSWSKKKYGSKKNFNIFFSELK